MNNGKLNEDMIKRIMTLIEEGHYIVTICDAVGINESSFYGWVKQGEADSKENKDTIYYKFLESYKNSKSVAEMRLLKTIEKDESWTSKAWILERRYKARWKKEEKVEHSGDLNITFVGTDDFLPGNTDDN